MIAVLVAAAFLVQLPSDVSANGWNYVGASGDGELLSFTLPFPARQNMLWIRWEFSAARLGPNGEWSARQLVEYDCQEGRLRTLQSEGFSAPNLTGRPVPNALNPTWVYVAPGTFNEQHHKAVCAAPTG